MGIYSMCFPFFYYVVLLDLIALCVVLLSLHDQLPLWGQIKYLA